MQLLKMITIVQSYMILHYGYNIFSSSDFGVRSENGSIEKTGLFSSSSKVKHYATKYYGNIKRNKAYRFSNSI